MEKDYFCHPYIHILTYENILCIDKFEVSKKSVKCIYIKVSDLILGPEIGFAQLIFFALFL